MNDRCVPEDSSSASPPVADDFAASRLAPHAECLLFYDKMATLLDEAVFPTRNDIAVEDTMPIYRVPCLSFSLLLFLWGMPAVVLAQYSSVVALGQQEFQAYCATCHGPKAKGDGPLTALLTIPPPDLTQLTKHNGGSFPFVRTYEQIDGSSKTVVPGHGPTDMPIWGEVFRRDRGTAEQWILGTSGRILAIVHYLESIQED